MAATMVSGLPSGRAGVSNRAVVGSTSGEIDPQGGGLPGRPRSLQRLDRGGVNLPLDVGRDRGKVGGACQLVALQEFGELRDRIPARFRFPLGGSLVELLVV
jgi:hypothetical protein